MLNTRRKGGSYGDTLEYPAASTTARMAKICVAGLMETKTMHQIILEDGADVGVGFFIARSRMLRFAAFTAHAFFVHVSS
mmetsp:Transcript_2755/g.4675  ORF Transcript_2755/g.4675 Transcript_2755/m.4675 type:complete len:80 (+) Transcript_2755:72-311(+)